MKDKIRKRIVQVLASVFLVAMVLLSVSGTAIPNAIADSNDTKQEYKGLNIEQFKELYNSTLKKDSEFMARYTNGKGNGINTGSTKLYVHNADLSKGGYKSIDFTERVELPGSGYRIDDSKQKKNLPYRYYLWFKKNEQKTGSAHWHTEKFIGTSKPVGSSYNAKLYDNTPGVISAEVARYEFGDDCITRQKSEGGSHLFNHYEDRLGHNAYDLYVIDLQKYIQTAWSNATYEVSEKNMLAFYNLCKESLKTPDQMVNTDKFQDLKLPIDFVETCFTRYEASKNLKHKYDYTDMLTKVYCLLRDNESVRKNVQKYYEYVIADEVQDFTPLMWKILALLVDNGTPLTCIGDEDQLIYSFRGAEINELLHFSTNFPGGKVFTSTQNRRCRKAIIDEASTVKGFVVGSK